MLSHFLVFKKTYIVWFLLMNKTKKRRSIKLAPFNHSFYDNILFRNIGSCIKYCCDAAKTSENWIKTFFGYLYIFYSYKKVNFYSISAFIIMLLIFFPSPISWLIFIFFWLKKLPGSQFDIARNNNSCRVFIFKRTHRSKTSFR